MFFDELADELEETDFLKNADDTRRINYLLKHINFIKIKLSNDLIKWTDLYDNNKNKDNYYSKFISEICLNYVKEQLDLINILEIEVMTIIPNDNNNNTKYYYDNSVIKKIGKIDFITSMISSQMSKTEDKLISESDNAFKYIQIMISQKNNI